MIRIIRRNGEILEIDDEEPQSVKELAWLTGHSEGYIYAMKRCGFEMRRDIGTRVQVASLKDYERFHQDNPGFRYTDAYER